VTIKEGRKTEIGEMHIFAEDRYTLRSKKEWRYQQGVTG
jgi:hypothetical protein